jgi:TolB protein
MKPTLRMASLLRIFLVVLTAACLAPPAARAQLQIQITSGVNNPVPIAIVSFAEAPTDGTDVAAVVQHDLVGSGRFTELPRDKMPATPTTAADVKFADWKAAGSDYVVVG